MAYCGYQSSRQVLKFLPLHEWTEVILVSIQSTGSDVYTVTTEEKEETRKKHQEHLSDIGGLLETIEEFRLFEIVVVKIDGEWYRGKLLSYNEFQDDDTKMELIDLGLFYQTKLKYVFEPPYYLSYDPLAISVIFKNFIPKDFTPNTTKLKIRPLLSESLLHEGVVLVEVDLGLNNIQNTQRCHVSQTHTQTYPQIVDTKKDLKFDWDSSSTSVQRMTIDHSNTLGAFLSGAYIEARKQFWILNGDYVELLNKNNYNGFIIRSNKMYDEYKTILEKLKNEKRKNLILALPKMHEIVLVYSSKFNGFYRAKLLYNVSDDNIEYIKLKYRLIDMGCKEKIQNSNIFKMPDFIKNQIPLMTYTVRLDGLPEIPIHQYPKIISHVKSKIGNSFKIFDDSVDLWNAQIVLREPQNIVSLNEEIQGLLRTMFLQRKISAKKSNKTEMEKPCHPIKSGSCVNVIHFENFNEIYVRDAIDTTNYNYAKYCQDLVDYYDIDFNRRHKSPLVMGDIICVDGIWRGRISQKLNEGFMVFNVDNGKKEKVNSKNMFEMPEELKKHHHFAFEVKLQHMPLLTTTHEKQVIRDYFKGKHTNYIIEFDEYNPNGLDNVILKTEQNIEISKQMIKLLNALL